MACGFSTLPLIAQDSITPPPSGGMIPVLLDDEGSRVFVLVYHVFHQIFLYKNYVGSSRGRRAMPLAMINEMIEPLHPRAHGYSGGR